jgi:DNA modification methylase
MTVRIINADVMEGLRQLPDASVHCVVTSPPYWGLRDYRVAGQIGLEPTLFEHLDRLVQVFREVRRVLRKDGTCWVNYGDGYAGSWGAQSRGADYPGSLDHPSKRTPQARKIAAGQPAHNGSTKGTPGLKPRDLMMMSNRLAIALQDDGWWVRAECVWGKPNAMPDSSGVARPAAAHEKIWLLTRSDGVHVWRARDTGELSYAPDLAEQVLMPTAGKMGPRWIGMSSWYDAGAVRIPRSTADDGKMRDGWDTGPGGHGVFHRGGREKGKRKTDKQRGHSRPHAGFQARWDAMSAEEQRANGRLLRNYEPAPLIVWDMPVAGFADAHFATFPPELAARCLKAGCPPGGVVLDPFAGSGTTGLVADRLGRDAILIELNPDYAAMAELRIRGDAPLLVEVGS